MNQPRSLSAATLGALGVVYGDIGTSPLYALREANAVAGGAADVTCARAGAARTMAVAAITRVFIIAGFPQLHSVTVLDPRILARAIPPIPTR